MSRARKGYLKAAKEKELGFVDGFAAKVVENVAACENYLFEMP